MMDLIKKAEAAIDKLPSRFATTYYNDEADIARSLTILAIAEQLKRVADALEEMRYLQ